MTIERGQQWGTTAGRPADLTIVDDDAALHQLVASARHDGDHVPPVYVRSGDLALTLGGNKELGTEVTLLPLDVVRVEADGATAWAVAHVVARQRWWWGQLVAMMNAEYLGGWDVAPRSHPNDGKVDIVTVDRSMSVRARWAARSRLPTGTHVPHPSISIRQVADASIEFDEPLNVFVDGMHWRTVRRLTVTVEPDAITACI